MLVVAIATLCVSVRLGQLGYVMLIGKCTLHNIDLIFTFKHVKGLIIRLTFFNIYIEH